MRETKLAAPPLDGDVDKSQGSPRTSSAPFPRSKRHELGVGGYHPPATVSLPTLLHKQSDQQFRRLVQDLLTVSRRLEMARDYFGRRIHVTGPQYNLLMTVAQLQGTTGVGVGSVAQAMHVSSAFVTSETGKLSGAGLIRKRPNPDDGRGALLSLTPAGRLKIDRLIGEIRTVNDLFFGLLGAPQFAELCASAGALARGSSEAMRHIERVEEASDRTI
ncbi:MAG TPA: MarR family transcriptional regulator [Bryobacteraceae bacterium]|nr:MarR family transcriptional regulator [Bryobacteraceae bacterium]